MNLEWFRTFRAVVDAKSYTKAAEHLLISQPAVSKQLRRLEGAFGCRLLERSGREFQLTPAGKRVYQLAGELDSNIAAARTDIRRLVLASKEAISIAGGPTPLVHFMAQPLKRFLEAHPTVGIRPVIGTTEALDALLLRGEIDVAVLQDSFVLEDPLEIAATLADEIIAVCAPEHPLAGREISPAMLATEQIICIRFGTESRRVLDDWFGQRGVFFRRVLEVATFNEVRVAAIANLGLGFLSRYSVESDIAAGRLEVARIADFTINRPLFVVHHKDIRPLVRELLREIAVEAEGPAESARLKLVHTHA